MSTFMFNDAELGNSIQISLTCSPSRLSTIWAHFVLCYFFQDNRIQIFLLFQESSSNKLQKWIICLILKLVIIQYYFGINILIFVITVILYLVNRYISYVINKLLIYYHNLPNAVVIRIKLENGNNSFKTLKK